jgi:agmatine deiminase
MRTKYLPFITTGGNVITDGMGTAFSSCTLLNKNRFFEVPEDRFFALNDSLAGFKNYHILSDFEMQGIQYGDCLIKLPDPERILVAEPPRDLELYAIYEKIAEKELKNLKNVFGRPNKIFRIKTNRYEKNLPAAYTHSIIVNKKIYMPLFQIKEGAEAIQTWQKVMPGYTAKGFTFDFNDEPVISEDVKDKYFSGYGWTLGAALHCRTRAVWDAGMLFIAVKQLAEKEKQTEPLTVYVLAIDYSKKGLIPGSAMLFWREKGEANWQKEPLISGGSDTGYSAVIPLKSGNEIIEYYISAASLAGKTETSPRTAPSDFHTTE